MIYRMEEESYCVPPGFRFHPTEEELVGYYLARKVVQQQAAAVDGIIQEVDLYSIEPWDLQARCGRHQQEYCYFFSYKDRKYPSGTGTRTNRATAAGFWKATGRDKPVLSTSSSQSAAVIGMRKTLVFYRGRAPNGSKTDWIIHEYSLVADHQQEGWVVCRAFQKPTTTTTTLLQRPPSSSSFFPAANTYARAPPLLHQLHPGYCGQYPPAAGGGGDAAGLLCSSNLLELEDDEDESKMMILSKIPRLASPTAVQTSGAGVNINVTTAPAAADHHRHPELLLAVKQQQQTCPIDWNLLDTLLHDSAAASTSLLY